jgi:hypothetical protein
MELRSLARLIGLMFSSQIAMYIRAFRSEMIQWGVVETIELLQ